MKITLFCHSLLSDWNHGNAHFLRGVVTALASRGHAVEVWEPRDAWSVENLVADRGALPIDELQQVYPALDVTRYNPERPDLDRALDGADLVLVHEWNDPSLVEAIGRRRARGGRFVLLFHDTHHRSVTDPEGIARYDLSSYDGVLAFGEAIRQVYLRSGWSRRVWTWHEAADTRTFSPPIREDRPEDLVWVGNWGDDERTRELEEYLLGPARRLGLRGTVHGVRYPDEALAALKGAGLRYRGWLPNYRVPDVFGRHKVTVHVPRRPYAEALLGIPTIRVFEALACGIPLICAPWEDTEGLFDEGDFLVVRSGQEMERRLRDVLNDPDLAWALGLRGRLTVLSRHTCSHRVDELLSIYNLVAGERLPEPAVREAVA